MSVKTKSDIKKRYVIIMPGEEKEGTIGE